MQPYYDKDGITLYCGDCLQILPSFDDQCVDVVFTDPPYNVGVEYGIHDDNMSQEEFVTWATKWFVHCRRISSTLLITTGHKQLPYYAQIEPWKWLLCCHKPAAMGRSPVGFSNWEPIALWGKGGKDGCDVIRAPIKPDSSIDFHPCPKPIEWAKQSLCLFSGQSVCDPFCGSGTTLRAAKDMGLHAIGIEQNEEYCKQIVERLAQGVFTFVV